MADLFLGIDIGGTTVNVGLCEADGTVRGRTSLAAEASRGAADTITRIAAAVHAVSLEHGTAVGCGVGVPGELDTARTRLARANHLPGWTDVPVAEQLGDRIGIPTVLENDANCAAWGEFVAGAGRGTRSIACFTLGTGVGGGVVIDGQLWLGANGAAGAFGHIVVDPNGPACKCGQRGCVEQYASATSIAARYGRGSARDAFDAVARGDAEAIAAVDWACDGLAAGVANVIRIVQPDVVVLAGGVAAAGTALVDRVRAGVARRVRASWLASVRIEASALGNDAGWIGAALCGAQRMGVKSHPKSHPRSYDLMRS